MRAHYLILLLVVSIFTVIFTENCTAKQPEIKNVKESAFKSYKDIPNITESELVAIENLKQSRSMFIYGVNITTEAFITNDDAVDGFARLLCDRLSALFGVQFIPQAYGWDTLNEKLDAKVIDFTGELSPNPERQKKYFMTTPLFQRTIKIFSNKHNEPLKIIAQDRAIKCGFLTGSTTYKLVKNSIALPFEPFFVEDEREAPALLKNKVIDAFIDESSAEALFEKSSFVKVDDFFPLYYSPLSLTSASPELEPIISVIQKYLKNGGFEEIRALYNLGANMYTKHRLFNLFSEEEKAYINVHNSSATTIPFGAEYDNYPIAFYNSKEKVFQGIAVDVLQKVASLTGLEFKVANKPETTWPDLLQQLEDGKIAVISELVPSKLRQGKFLWTDKPNSVDRYALLSRSDYPNIDINQIVYSKVGLIAESAAAELFHEWFPDSLKATSYVDYPEAFEALEKGEIDLLMATETLLLSLTNYLEKPGFKANIVFQQSSEAFFGLNREEAVLQSIINKSLLLINSEYISDSWKRRVFDYKSKMLKDTFPYISALVFLLLLGFITAALLLIKNRRMSHNLEFIVVQRTQELEKVSRAKSDFLSSMSHEMRTPMNAIIGMTKIADRTEEVAKLRYCLSVIQASSTHLLGLINDILDMSKIEAGKFELHSAPFNLDNTLRKICNLIIDKTTQKKQKLSVVLNKEMHLSYVGDELKLSQVITNLLSNAVKFTPEGGTISLIVTEVERKEERSILRFQSPILA